jgi:very-short-patch-repair endonuclease
MRFDRDIQDLCAQQHGVVGVWQARELGVTRTEVSRLRRSKSWVAMTDRVLRSAAAGVTDELRASAGVLDAGRGAVLSHRSAAAWWRVRGFDLRAIEVSQREPCANQRPTLARLHDLRSIPDRWTTTLSGVPVVRPQLLVYQLCGSGHPDRAERALDNAWSLRLVDWSSMQSVLDELAASGRNGTTLLRSLLEVRGPSHVPPASNLESRFMKLVSDAGIRSFRRQVDVGGHRWTGRVDFLDQDVPLVVEIQSELYHEALTDKEADARRFAELERAGFVVCEVWDTALFARAQTVVRTIQEARRAASASPAQRTHFCVR